jgi:thymidylate kinase
MAKVKKEMGSLFALYGINYIGKTTQAKKLVERMNHEGFPAEYQKYPLYELPLTGNMINAYLREGNPDNLTRREFQMLNALNKTQGERKVLRNLYARGIHVVAEDYVGTSLAWGMASGISKNFLLSLNTHLHKEDLGILLAGTPFESGREKNHKHENDQVLMEEVAYYFRVLAQEFGWHVVNANQGIDDVHEQIWATVHQELTSTV